MIAESAPRIRRVISDASVRVSISLDKHSNTILYCYVDSSAVFVVVSKLFIFIFIDRIVLNVGSTDDEYPTFLLGSKLTP